MRAGLPTNIQLSGTDFATIEPTSTITLLPIVISPMPYLVIKICNQMRNINMTLYEMK